MQGEFALLRGEGAGEYLVWMGDGSGLVTQEEQESLLVLKEGTLVGWERKTSKQTFTRPSALLREMLRV